MKKKERKKDSLIISSDRNNIKKVNIKKYGIINRNEKIYDKKDAFKIIKIILICLFIITIKIVLLCYYIITIQIIPALYKEKKIYNKRRALTQNSEITIKINTLGNQSIVNSAYYQCPNEIYLNGIKIDDENICTINLTNETNIIKMIWYNKFKTCSHMFSGLDKIVEIDLSKFDTSSFTYMDYMFYGCTSLESINFNNISTSNVYNMHSMFCNCR